MLTQHQIDIVHLMTTLNLNKVTAYVLVMLHVHKFCTPVQIRKETGIVQPSISKTFKELKELDLVRSRDTDDKRSVEYHLIHPLYDTFELLTGVEFNLNKLKDLLAVRE